MWRDGITQLARGLEHPAWGLAHCERTYRTTLELASAERVRVREPVVFAVAYLHDIGAFERYRHGGRPQYESSASAAEEILSDVGFPHDLDYVVVDCIRAHDFVREPLPLSESRCFHDADILDFMGAVGITRLLSIVGLEDWMPDVRSAVEQIREFADTLPGKLVTRSARDIAKSRGDEMLAYLESLDAETAQLAEV